MYTLKSKVITDIKSQSYIAHKPIKGVKQNYVTNQLKKGKKKCKIKIMNRWDKLKTNSMID